MFELKYTYEKSTKNMVRFNSEDHGTYYIPKSVYEGLGAPTSIKVSIESADA